MPYPVATDCTSLSSNAVLTISLRTPEQLSDPTEPFELGDASLEQQRAHKRMMKNRASAARSRQRKQAYVDELEDKVRQLEDELDKAKKEIEELKELQGKLKADKTE